MLPGNDATLEVIVHSGMRYKRRLQGGVEDFVIPLDTEVALLDAIDERDRGRRAQPGTRAPAALGRADLGG